MFDTWAVAAMGGFLLSLALCSFARLLIAEHLRQKATSLSV